MKDNIFLALEDPVVLGYKSTVHVRRSCVCSELTLSLHQLFGIVTIMRKLNIVAVSILTRGLKGGGHAGYPATVRKRIRL